MEIKLWAGSTSNLQQADRSLGDLQTRLSAGTMVEENEDAPRLLEIDGGLATISIKGPLVNSDSPYLEMFGVTGYPEIRAALISAASDPTVDNILLDVDSGGGSVSGVEDTAKLIHMINTSVKPITAFADTAASAAYWLASSAGEVFASRTSMIGSIGVIATHKEYSEAYKKEGVGVTVIRAGKEKALANSNEKLTDKGKQQIQQMVDATYQVFVEHVATMRGKSYSYADESMAQGKEFIGQTAFDVGLIDGVKSFDEVVGSLRSQPIDVANKSKDNRFKPMGANTPVHEITGEAVMAKNVLTEQQIAAMALGATLESDIEAVKAAEDVEVEAVADSVADDAGVETEAAVAESMDVSAVALLKEQLKASQDDLMLARIETSKLTDKLTALDAIVDPLKGIASAAINNLQVALGGSAVDVSGLDAKTLLAEHVKLVDQFKSKFKAGGVAAVSATGDDGSKLKTDPRHMARVNAVRHQVK